MHLQLLHHTIELHSVPHAAQPVSQYLLRASFDLHSNLVCLMQLASTHHTQTQHSLQQQGIHQLQLNQRIVLLHTLIAYQRNNSATEQLSRETGVLRHSGSNAGFFVNGVEST